ncbi:MAG TPA: oxidoreductase [Mycobacteriales bacterium]|nr:oxidoreductase [Mycobacteriales bacterium]
MALFGRRRRRRASASQDRGFGRSGFTSEDKAHLENFLRTRRGVEAYLEPATNVTPWTVVLVAHDGEWTRRPCEEHDAARDFAERARIPVYDVAATGYPPRMREWSARRKRAGDESPRRDVRPGPTVDEMPPDPFL